MIEYFTGPGRTNFSVWLSRGGRYITLFRKILKEHGLPQDLAYLSLIESGFNPKARSVAGAVGPWQFMPGTARRMGLKINFYLDERRHPMKSTRAASAYLSKLYEDFGNWHLGARRIQRRRTPHRQGHAQIEEKRLLVTRQNAIHTQRKPQLCRQIPRRYDNRQKPGSFRLRGHRL